ncbi:unnamed protein product [[Actinomadura] parvosata subsp. kistnae]|uniref:Polymerase nucleotidyl transferase domain-containing protein n=1 Tax=[Actinomadura] parvosata subsp. kistnae TaxID=1909395 RepID=A0A1U9ZWY3_9ACTN|nr:hypothetical protein BKM31_14240 [Nonomuraea sp. ATCC 55076]SPL88701.1 unnamed protein product [Actinomadura parvosata subsp. kistnae]
MAELVEDVRLNGDETFFWSGSWVEGFANSRSDLDLYLISPDPGRTSGVPQVTGPGMPPMYMTLTPGRTKIDLTVVPVELLVKLNGFLTAFNGETDYPTAWSDNFREFVHRLSIGVPLANAERFDEIQRGVDFMKFRQYLMRFYQNRADGLFDDAQGLLDEGDVVSAYFVARQRVEAAIDMYLAANGETNTRVDKWRWKKLKRLLADDTSLADRFLDCEAIGGTVHGDTLALTQRCLQFGDEIILKAI